MKLVFSLLGRKPTYKAGLIIICILFAPICEAQSNINKAMVVRYWYKDLPTRETYQFALLKLVLEKTIPSHGPYVLIKSTEDFPVQRSYVELKDGNNINVVASSGEHDLDRMGNEVTTTIKKPILFGLLGYRRLLIRGEDQIKFNKITTLEELHSKVIGQGQYWVENRIYEENGFRLVTGTKLPQLINMLQAKRFDFLPLGVIEIDDILKETQKRQLDIKIAKNILLFYPHPVYFKVSIRHPELAERISLGLDIVKQDGSLKNLFEQHFSEELKSIREKETRVFILKGLTTDTEINLAEPSLLKR